MKRRTETLSPALLEMARRTADGELAPWANRRARENLAQSLNGKTRLQRRWVGSLAFATFAISMLVLCINAFHLRFSVDGESVTNSAGYVHAGEKMAAISFSDGTAIDIEPHSTVRIEHSGFRGADLVQEQGRATYAVVHRPAASWSVAAGPYRVRVTGTRFAVMWSPESGQMLTELYEGSVIVEGPHAEKGVALLAGQRFRGGVGQDVVVESIPRADIDAENSVLPKAAAIEENAAPESQPESSAKETAPSAPNLDSEAARSVSSANPVRTKDSQPEVRKEQPPVEDKPVAAPESLSVRLARGEARAIADEVEKEGAETFAARVSAADLVLIADAARYAQRPTLANSLLLLLRQRHPGTREAALAAFHLGRGVDSANPTQAMTWYETYLSETSGAGPFAAEARGLKMAATRRTAGDAAAKPLAEVYLKLHPKGAHAQLARTILATP
jgi:FecR protein